MKKLLIICMVFTLCGCAATRITDNSLYKKELSEKKISKADYNYLVKGQNEIHAMYKSIRR
jgi:hypothetical protein